MQHEKNHESFDTITCRTQFRRVIFCSRKFPENEKQNVAYELWRLWDKLWGKPSAERQRKDRAIVPNEIFLLGLSPGTLAVYSYLLRCANRRTQQCWPSYKTIGAATKMSVNTVRKHVCSLADKGLISTEDTTVFTKTGLKHNGSLLYTICPFQDVLDSHQQSELRRLEVERARWE
jgi:predicted transcriptional regulator